MIHCAGADCCLLLLHMLRVSWDRYPDEYRVSAGYRISKNAGYPAGQISGTSLFMSAFSSRWRTGGRIFSTWAWRPRCKWHTRAAAPAHPGWPAVGTLTIRNLNQIRNGNSNKSALLLQKTNTVKFLLLRRYAHNDHRPKWLVTVK